MGRTVSKDDFDFIRLGRKVLFSALFPTESQPEFPLISQFRPLYSLGCSGILMGSGTLSVLCSCVIFLLVVFLGNSGNFFWTCSICYLEVDI